MFAARRVAQEKRRPAVHPGRTASAPVSAALRAYASMATRASDGAYRRVPTDHAADRVHVGSSDGGNESGSTGQVGHR